jgi:hypothetical protein
MSLEQSKIIANTKKYFDTANKHGFMTDDLMKFLGEDLIKAPATNLTSLYGAYEGGLIEHMLRVAKYAVAVNNSLSEDERVDMSSLLKVCLLHQIGKTKLYIPCTSDWHIKNQGKMYDYNNDLTSMRVGERSVYYAQTNGVKLTEEEYYAIISYDKTEDKMADYHNSLLGELLKMGNTLAIKTVKK